MADYHIAFLAHHYKIVNNLQYKRTVNEDNGMVEIDEASPYVAPNPQTKLTSFQVAYEHDDFFGQQLSLSAYKSDVNVGYEAALQWRITD